MNAQSSVVPDDFWIRRRGDGKACIVLRKNVEVNQREEDEGTSTYYEYDEVEVVISDRKGLANYVDGNFDALFDMGVDRASMPEPLDDKGRIAELEQIVADMLMEQMGVG